MDRLFDKIVKNYFDIDYIKEVEYCGFLIKETPDNMFSLYYDNDYKKSFNSIKLAKEYIDSAVSGN